MNNHRNFLITEFLKAEHRIQSLQSIFRGSKLRKVRYYPWRAIVSKIIFLILPSLQERWIVQNTLFTKDSFFTEGYFLDYYLTGIIGEDNERYLTKWLLGNLTEEEVFFDIGAHYGYYSLVVSSALMDTSHKVFAFEPTPTTYNVLQRNTANHPDIISVQCALTDHAGTKALNVYRSGSKRGSNSFYADAALAITKDVKLTATVVPTTTIDMFCEQNSIVPTMIKLDIENAELDALRGGHQTLLQHHPKIVMEVWPYPHNSRHHEAAIYLEKLGYQLYKIDSDGQVKSISMNTWFESINSTENLVALL